MRGYQKKVIFFKNPGSDLFEEAYFIVKDGADRTHPAGDIIKEADRIIKEHTGLYKRGKRVYATLGNLIIFGTGFFSAAVLSLLLLLVIL